MRSLDKPFLFVQVSLYAANCGQPALCLIVAKRRATKVLAKPETVAEALRRIDAEARAVEQNARCAHHMMNV